jgi:hypothetical protein
MIDVLLVNNNATLRTARLGSKLRAQAIDVQTAILEVGSILQFVPNQTLAFVIST